MLAKNNSYFSPELCVDGHYIITGYTNDSFCNERQQLTDITYELYNYLKETQGFDAVIFLDGLFMLGCYDQTSFDILSGKRTSENRKPEGHLQDRYGDRLCGKRYRSFHQRAGDPWPCR